MIKDHRTKQQEFIQRDSAIAIVPFIVCAAVLGFVLGLGMIAPWLALLVAILYFVGALPAILLPFVRRAEIKSQLKNRDNPPPRPPGNRLGS